jgi:tetratricopeptide (TPR) repeat protein
LTSFKKYFLKAIFKKKTIDNFSITLMTNEELLAKYLENSLTDTESAEFQKLLNSSPEFARDVRELSKIEGFLTAGAITAAVPEDFLAGVENHVAEKIHHDKYHGPASGNAFNKILSGFWIVPLLFLLGVGGYFLLRNSDEKVQPQQENPAVVLQEQSAQTPEIQPQPETPVAHSELPQPKAENPAITQNDEITQQQPVANPDKMTASATKEKNNAQTAAFEKTQENLLKARAAGQKAQEAALLKQLGILSAKNGNTHEAKTYFNDGINLARTLRLTELEAESLGELGMVFKNEGDKGAAVDNFKKAIELLKRVNQPTERWEKELKSVQ